MNPYVSSGTRTALCLGRDRELSRLRDRLVRATPAHVSIIAPKQYGKTVLMTRLAEVMRQEACGYAAVALVDLRHGTPETDEQFRQRLSSELRCCLNPSDPDLAKELQDAAADVLGDMLQIVLQTLGERGRRLLILFDGFDYVPIGAGVTANLLDQLRSLAQLPSVYFAISSRHPLRELCKNAASRSSDFWRIFGDPIRFGAFREDDWEPVWQPLRDRGNEVQGSAMSELRTWSGGVPLLAACVLEHLHDHLQDRDRITNVEVREACDRIEIERPETIGDVWDACNVESQEILIAAAEGEVREGAVSSRVRGVVEEMGFATISGGVMRFQSRCMGTYAKARSSGLADLNRLFGEGDAFETNMARVLELRLRQLQGVDGELEKSIEYAIRDLAEDPRRTLDSARGIVEAALDVIWRAEALNNVTDIPASWRQVWENAQNVGLPTGITRMPDDRGEQCKLLRYMTGRTPTHRRVAQRTSRQTSMLLDQVSGFGNFVNHRSGEAARFGPACAMCFAATELLASLSIDFASGGQV